VGSGEYVRLKCKPETLDALAGALTHYGRTDGEPEWLVAGVWICAKGEDYLATSSVEILPDGFVARSLSICPPEEIANHLEGELPNITARLASRGNGRDLPPVEAPSPPKHLNPWPTERYDTKILVRVSRRALSTNRVACGLLFTAEDGRRLLIGSDPSTLALVLSEDSGLIDLYCEECEELSPAEYSATA
jgi:hypothetical protein